MPTPRAISSIRRIAGRARDRIQQRIMRPQVDRVQRRAAARLKDLSHRFEGMAYRVADRQPDPHVSDGVITQRVRSQLGPVERRLDVPRLHVTVHDHIAELRGVVGTERQAETLIEAVRDVAGVHGVLSFLHIGYGPGDTKPSEGRKHRAPSQAWRDLVGCVRELDEDDTTAEAVATSVLVHLLLALPEGEGDHLRSHLPLDVRDRIAGFVHVGQPLRARGAEDFIEAVGESAHVPLGTAEMATRQVFATLQLLVPEETADITATLPAGLKDLWRTPAVPAPSS